MTLVFEDLAQAGYDQVLFENVIRHGQFYFGKQLGNLVQGSCANEGSLH